MYTNERETYRQTFFVTWQKYQKKLALEPLEMQLIEVILAHPEYHALLENENGLQSQEFAPEENPILHMSLHLALREQLQLNRPAGITTIYQQLLAKEEHHHALEHRMMGCLAQTLWEAQQIGTPPSEVTYLEKLQTL